eukprot:gb/GECG01008749.1/.p1 GENE.gb/GECG01008749.1/~~gb/GECG01008749.1/.p1  ORF type:complete len:958 (+),score=105.84 gb/GECG01008749.1/:1-2874(+)
MKPYSRRSNQLVVTALLPFMMASACIPLRRVESEVFSRRCSNTLVTRRSILRALSAEVHHLANHIFDVWIELVQLVPKVGRCFLPILTSIWWRSLKKRLCGHAKKSNQWVGHVPPPSVYVTEFRDSATPMEVVNERLKRLLCRCTPQQNRDTRTLLCEFEYSEGFDPPFGGPLQHETSLAAAYMLQTVLKLAALYQSDKLDKSQKNLSRSALVLVRNSLQNGYSDRMRRADARKVATEGLQMQSYLLPSITPTETDPSHVVPLGVSLWGPDSTSKVADRRNPISYSAREWDLGCLENDEQTSPYFKKEGSYIDCNVVAPDEEDIAPKWLCNFHHYEEPPLGDPNETDEDPYYNSDLPESERHCSYKGTENLVDVIVFQHGLQGSVTDLRILRAFIKAYYMYGHKSAHFAPAGTSSRAFFGTHASGVKFEQGGFTSVGQYRSPSEYQAALEAEFPPVRLLTCSPKSNQGDASSESLLTTSVRFAKEVDEFICSRVVDQGYNLRRLCFVGFSLGGLIVRLGLRHPALMQYVSHFHSLVTIASPHLGVTHDTSALFDTGVYLMRKLGRSKVMDELSLQDDNRISNSLLYAMCVGWSSSIKASISPRVADNINIMQDAISRMMEEERETRGWAKHSLSEDNDEEAIVYHDHHEQLVLGVVHMCIQYLKYNTVAGHPHMWDDALHFLGTYVRSRSARKKKSKTRGKPPRHQRPPGKSSNSQVQVDNVYLNVLSRLSSTAPEAFSDDESSEEEEEVIDDSVSDNSYPAQAQPEWKIRKSTGRLVSPSARSQTSSSSSISASGQKTNGSPPPPLEEDQTSFLNPFNLHSGDRKVITPDAESNCMEALKKEGYWNGSEGCLLRHFEHVWLVGSEQDKYSPFYSCLACLPELSIGSPGRCENIARMLEGFWHGVDMRRVCRFVASFELSNRVSMNSVLGREAHLQYCENEKAAQWLAVMIGKMMYE